MSNYSLSISCRDFLLKGSRYLKEASPDKSPVGQVMEKKKGLCPGINNIFIFPGIKASMTGSIKTNSYITTSTEKSKTDWVMKKNYKEIDNESK